MQSAMHGMRGACTNVRQVVMRLAALWLAMTLAGCGGSGSDPDGGPEISQFRADSSSYFVGEQARLTAIFSNGTGRLDPGDIAVTSGQPVTTPQLTGSIRYKLTVSDGTHSTTRDLDLTVSYRERMRTIAAPFARAGHATAALDDGRIIIFGGEDAGSTLPHSIYVFDPATETFAPFGSLSSGRVAFTAVSLYSGDVLVLGGLTALAAAPSAEIIDGQTGTVAPTQQQPVYHRFYAAASKFMDGRVLITGGLRNGGPADDSVEIYDPATGRFTLLSGTLAVARADHIVVRIDDRKFLIYGGVTLDNEPAPPELFDPVTATSTVLQPPESTSRYRHVAHTMQDGGIWIVGGENFDGNPITSILRFDPASSAFASTLNMATARSSAALQRLTDGRVLIAGGTTTRSSGSATHTTELLTPGGQRRDGPAMSAKRQVHTIDRLPSGKLLVFGGLDENRLALAAAEIFE